MGLIYKIWHKQQKVYDYHIKKLHKLIIMSLFIIGSTSRITSNIILQLAKNNQYQKITLLDLLPSYDYHHRFYRLQNQIDNVQYKVDLTLDKPTLLNDLKKCANYDDVLFVTHDYYTNVTSKTKLMEYTATVCSGRKNLYFATPVEYDHFGFANPEQNYLQSEKIVQGININSTFIRSDVQDKTQTLAYFNSEKTGLLEKQAFSSRFHFSPRIVKAGDYADVVCQVLANKIQGKRLIVRGKQSKDAFYGDFSREIQKQQYEHAKQNIVSLAQKYNGVHFDGYEEIDPK